MSDQLQMVKKDSSGILGNPPKTRLGKLLSSTPVIMTIVATLLAGLANSEMTQAQYGRSLAAQQQSKAGDQWNLFQAKRLRGATLHGNLRLLQSTTDVGALNPSALLELGTNPLLPQLPQLASAVGFLVKGEMPRLSPRTALPPEVVAAEAVIAAGGADGEVLPLVRRIPAGVVEAALKVAYEDARAMDALTSPINETTDGLEQQILARLAVARESTRGLMRDFTAARLRLDATRYDAEAKYNRVIAQLIDVQVRQSNASAERHYLRSQKFFFGMLGAQCAVIIASLAIAVQRRNLIWAFAAVIGIAAVCFGVYVFLYT